MIELQQAKGQAKALHAALTNVANPATLTHSQCLDLLAQMNDAPNWSKYWSSQHQMYFHARHEAYLPSPLALVRALSVRKAVGLELAQTAPNNQGGSPTASALALVEQAMAQFRQQANQARKGTLHVAPVLQKTLTRTTAANQALLRAEESTAESAMQSLCKSFESPAGLSPCYTLDQARAYHSAYLAWRLASLASAVCAMRQQDNRQAFGTLASEGVDLPAYAAGLLLGELTPAKPLPVAELKKKLTSLMSLTLGRQARRRARVILMAVLESGSAEASLLPVSEGLPFSTAELLKGAQVLRRAFPEIAAWHAWLELKPLLAQGIGDTAHPR